MDPSPDDPALHRLLQKHHEYETRLLELRQRRFLSDDEQREEATLKKLKLKIKDEIESIKRHLPEAARPRG